MEPVSIVSLVAGCTKAVETVVRLGCGLRRLQREFSGALDTVDNIAHQIANIELALREICSLLCSSPGTLPPAFESRLGETASAIDKTAAQIQEHAQSVEAAAVKSTSKAKLKHVWNANKVAQWERNLELQVQALSLLLQVAQLRSNDERASVLDQDSSKRLFERASSMSAKVVTSSSAPSSERPRSADLKTFSFDPTLLHTKVYRRACESSLRREVSISKDDIGVNISGSSSSISSDGAIASQSGDGDHGLSLSAEGSMGQVPSLPDTKPNHSEKINRPGATWTGTSEQQEPQQTGFQHLSESSTLFTTENTTSSCDSGEAKSTPATTMSSLPQSKMAGETRSRHDTSLRGSKVLVIVENVGTDSVELPVGDTQDPYKAIHKSIYQVRDRVLTAGGVDPATYRGSMTNCTIATSGQAIHKFPFTVAFLEAALEQLDGGLYSAIDITAQFSAPTESSGDPLGTVVTRTAQTESSSTATFGTNRPVTGQMSNLIDVPHFVLRDNLILPFVDAVPIGKGGFGEVYKFSIQADYDKHFSNRDFAEGIWAVKKITSPDKRAFRNETECLRRFSSEQEHPHIIKLLATYTSQNSNKYYLMFPWAEEGNLRDFWRNNTPESCGQAQRSNGAARWMIEQCAGLADALRQIHAATDDGRHWRHNDIKPENILCFKNNNMDSAFPTWKIADFGLAAHVRTDTTKHVYTAHRGGTLTYRAPECDLTPVHPEAQRSDIWSMGCLMLECAIWVQNQEGWKKQEKFRANRRRYTKDQAFFVTDGNGSCNLNPAVDQQLENLRIKASDFDRPIDEILIAFLALVVSCLEVDPRNRPASETLAEQFKELGQKLKIDIATKRGSSRLLQSKEAIERTDTSGIEVD